jgi:hypothetical protein
LVPVGSSFLLLYLGWFSKVGVLDGVLDGGVGVVLDVVWEVVLEVVL